MALQTLSELKPGSRMEIRTFGLTLMGCKVISQDFCALYDEWWQARSAGHDWLVKDNKGYAADAAHLASWQAWHARSRTNCMLHCSPNELALQVNVHWLCM